MCGIAGIFAYGAGSPPVDRTELLRMRDRMAARGPDGSGEWRSPDGRELRRELEAREVLLKLYTVYGIDMLPKLRGMFAFGLWDAQKQGLLLARDPFGIKPLYYAEYGRTFGAETSGSGEETVSQGAQRAASLRVEFTGWI